MSGEMDPVTFEVLANALSTIGDEESLILMRTACSSIVRDSMDFSTAICDAQGRTLGQGLCQPLQLGGFDDPMRLLVTRHGGNIHPGDIFIANDPHVAMGQHLPDIFIIKPIFIDGALQGWATTIAHHADVGGIVPGSNALGASEIYQEGLRLPFLKLLEKGKPNEAIWDIIRLNVRVPDLVLGDLNAQISACLAGEREFTRLYRRYGAGIMTRFIEELHDYAERMARAEIAEMPNGTYTFTDHIDGLGANPEPIVLKLKIIIEDTHVTIDWTGTSPQVKGGVNSSLPYTKAAGYAALRSIMSGEIPTCTGFTRAITTIAPQGTVVNPVSPAPCGARGITGYRMMDCLYGAIAEFAPDRVAADSSGGSTLAAFSAVHEGKTFVFVETLMGSWGATAEHDGQDGVTHIGANQSNIPIEMIEAEYPLRIERYGLVEDSGGPGKHRGGLGLIREYRILADDVVFTVRSDKRQYPPHGLYGGKLGGKSWNIVNPGTEDRILPVLPTEPTILKRNDVFRHIQSGGGGYGNPLDRDSDLVLLDVMDRRVSIEQAGTVYGVIITGRSPPAVDRKTTDRTRAAMRRSAGARGRGDQQCHSSGDA